MRKLVGIVAVVAWLACAVATAQVAPEGPSDPFSVVPERPHVNAGAPWPDAFIADYGGLYPSFQRGVGSVAVDRSVAPLLDRLLAFAQSQADVPGVDDAPALGTCAYLGGTGGTLVGDGGSGTLFADGGAGSLVPDGGTGSLVGDGGAVLQPFVGAFFKPEDQSHAWSLAFVSSTDRSRSMSLPTHLHDDIAIIDRFELDAFEEGVAGSVATSRGASLEVAWQLALTPRVALGRTSDLIVVPHGHLVLHHALQALIGHYGPVHRVHVDRVSMPERVEITLTWSAERTTRVTLFPMNFRSLDGLGAALAFLAGADATSRRIVMSWTLSNCALLARYGVPEATEPTSPPNTTSYAVFLYSLLVEGLEDGGQPLLEALCEALRLREEALADVPCDDTFALAALLADLERRATEDVGDGARSLTSPVLWLRGFAASGNHGLPFPLPPASWPGVYGVAACSPGQPAAAWFSNRGDVISAEHVIAPGAWYFESPLGAHDDDLGYWGTSFAAPYAALRFVAPQAEGTTGPFALGTCNVSIVAARYRR